MTGPFTKMAFTFRSFLVIIFIVAAPSANAQDNCIRIGDSTANVDSSIRRQFIIKKFPDYELWWRGKSYIVIVNGKLASHFNDKKSLPFCDVKTENSKEGIENWILQKLSEFAMVTENRSAAIELDKDKTLKIFTEEGEKKFWFNDYYLVMEYKTSTRESLQNRETHTLRRVMIPVEGINAIVDIGGYYRFFLKKGYSVVKTNMETKVDELAPDFDLRMDERGDDDLEIRMKKALKDLKKYYKAPPKKKELY